jgi:hypothetical protein
MAPKNEPSNFDAGKIDINLKMVGDDGLKAITSLAQQMSVFQQYMATVMAGGSSDQAAQAAARMAGTFNANTAGGVPVTGPHPYQSTPPTVHNTPDAHGQSSSVAPGIDLVALERNNESFRERAGRYRDRLTDSDGGKFGNRIRNLADEEIARASAREEEQARSRAGTGVSGQHSRGNATRDLYESSRGTPAGGGIPTGPRTGVSPGAPNPSEDPSYTPDWMRRIYSNPQAARDGFESPDLPQFGNLTVQDKLKMGSGYFQRRAFSQYARAERDARDQVIKDATVDVKNMDLGYTDEEARAIAESDHEGIARRVADHMETSDVGSSAARKAMLLRMGAENATNVVTAYRNVKGLGTRAFNYTSNIQATGTALGYDRAGIIGGGGPLGMTKPWDIPYQGLGAVTGLWGDHNSAAYEGARERFNIARLRLKGGIGDEQSKAIVGDLAGLGWSGDRGQNMAFDGIAPLVQKGLDPGVTVSMLDKSIRNGNSSAKEFLKTMDGIGKSARDVNMPLKEYLQALDQQASTLKDMGGTYASALRTSRGVNVALGINPQQGEALMNSPLFQAQAAKFGIPMDMIGSISRSKDGPAIMASMTENMVNLARRTAHTANRDRTVVFNGKVIGHISGKAQEDAYAARTAGLSVPEFLRVEKGARHSTERAAIATQVAHMDDLRKGSKPNIHWGDSKEKITKEINKFKSGFIAEGKEWKTVMSELNDKSMVPTGPKAKAKYLAAVKDISGMTPGKDRSDKVKRLMADMAKPMQKGEQRHNMIDLTDSAKKLVKMMEGGGLNSKGRQANRGGLSRASILSTGEDVIMSVAGGPIGGMMAAADVLGL